MKRTSVLFICTGNICRSPTAEGVLRHKLQALGLGKLVEVASAGTTGYHAGEPPDARAVRHARSRGYDLSRQRARRLSRKDFERYDWIVAMDDGHIDILRDLAPAEGGARVSLLLAHSARFADVRQVPDPYYGSAAGFDRVLDLIEDACDGFIEALRNDEGTSPPKA